jgi:hypothetical protein
MRVCVIICNSAAVGANCSLCARLLLHPGTQFVGPRDVSDEFPNDEVARVRIDVRRKAIDAAAGGARGAQAELHVSARAARAVLAEAREFHPAKISA